MMPRKWIILIVIGMLVVLVISSMARRPNPVPTTLDGAVLALGHMGEWAKWMAGIQTAALGALGFLILRDTQKALVLSSTFEVTCAVTTFVALGAGLFCSAWILSSLPSLAIRLHSIPLPPAGGEAQEGAEVQRCIQYDIYEQPLYGWANENRQKNLACTPELSPLERSRFDRVVNVAYMLTLQHYLWGIGLLSLAGNAFGILRHSGVQSRSLSEATAHNPADGADV